MNKAARLENQHQESPVQSSRGAPWQSADLHNTRIGMPLSTGTSYSVFSNPGKHFYQISPTSSFLLVEQQKALGSKLTNLCTRSHSTSLGGTCDDAYSSPFKVLLTTPGVQLSQQVTCFHLRLTHMM